MILHSNIEREKIQHYLGILNVYIFDTIFFVDVCIYLCMYVYIHIRNHIYTYIYFKQEK